MRTEDRQAAAPVYDESWIHRYENLAGADQQVVSAEMVAFTGVVGTALGGVRRRSIRQLDLGTCTGRYLRWGISQGFGLVCGIDRSPATVEYCMRTVRGRGAHVYCADLLNQRALASTAGRLAPFRLVTMMLGTINHIHPARQPGLLRSVAGLMDSSGLLVLSSWRRERCLLSLYSQPERRFLEAALVDERRAADLALASSLRLVQVASTPWQLVTAWSPCLGGP